MVLYFTTISVNAQTSKPDTTINLDLLKAPTSPAFNLLGVSPSDIERPTDINAFLVSIQNGTNNYTSFPKNYAVEFAPWLIFKKTGNTLDKFNSRAFKDVFQQSFQVSLGISQQNLDDQVADDSTAFTRSGIGFKFSLIRQPWSEETEKNFTALQKAQVAMLDEFENRNISTEVAALAEQEEVLRDSLVLVDRDATLTATEKRAIITRLSQQFRQVKARKNDKQNELIKTTEAYAEAKKIASSFKVERKRGGYLDFATGMVLDFPDKRFNYSEISKAGAWLTGGYDGGNNNSISILGIVRYLYQPSKIFADESNVLQTNDISTLDAGAKAYLNALKGRFTLSAEAIYRSVLNKDLIDPSWRFIFNVEYDVGMNQKLTFSFGRNFDGVISKGGNLVTALNFIKGFGSSKKIGK